METKERKKKKQPKFVYGKYKIYITDVVRDRFDIFEEKTNGKTNRKSESLIGYGYRFEDMIEKLCRVAISEKDMTTFKDYVTEFKKERAKIQEILK